MAKQKYGYMKCETRKCVNGEGGAGHVVVMKDEKTGTLSYRCDECQGQGRYALAGTAAFAQWEGEIQKVAAPAPEKKPEPKPAADPKKKEPAAPEKKGSGLFV